MSFGNLTGEHQAHTRAAWLRRKERHEQVGGVSETGPVVLHPHVHSVPRHAPTDTHAALGLEGCVDRVPQQVDEKLVELVGITLDADVGSSDDLDAQPLLEGHRARDPRWDVDLRKCRRWKMGKTRVRGHEPP